MMPVSIFITHAGALPERPGTTLLQTSKVTTLKTLSRDGQAKLSIEFQFLFDELIVPLALLAG